MFRAALKMVGWPHSSRYCMGAFAKALTIGNSRSATGSVWRWRHQIANWHAARVTNAATEAANNLIKRVKRAAFGFTNFANYRIRALLYAGKPNWALLDTLTPT